MRTLSWLLVILVGGSACRRDDGDKPAPAKTEAEAPASQAAAPTPALVDHDSMGGSTATPADTSAASEGEAPGPVINPDPQVRDAIAERQSAEMNRKLLDRTRPDVAAPARAGARDPRGGPMHLEAGPRIDPERLRKMEDALRRRAAQRGAKGPAPAAP